MAAIKSRPECSASESMPRLPVAAAKNTFKLTRIIAEPMDPSAAICFTDVGDSVMEESSKRIIRRVIKDFSLWVSIGSWQERSPGELTDPHRLKSVLLECYRSATE